MKPSNGRKVSGDGSEERRGGSWGELEKDEWCEAKSGQWKKREDGWVEGLQRWVAEQHESDCGPQLGQSWGSLLITTRIRPRLLTVFDSALLVQTSSPLFTCSFLLALQEKWFVLEFPAAPSIISPESCFRAVALFPWLCVFLKKPLSQRCFQFRPSRWPLIRGRSHETDHLLWLWRCWGFIIVCLLRSLLKENQFQR